ncbi:Hydroxypyruvate reductase [Candidatus Entotheonellaceae bacterium PAL068K]
MKGVASVAQYKVVAGKTSGALAQLRGANYEMEREALDPIGAEVVVVDASNEDDLIAQAQDADAIIGQGLRLTPKVIAALEKCKIISGSGVGFDYVDLLAASQAGIVVTNVPDVFIEEVADHAMTLLLACWRRLIEQDRIVRQGRWPEGRLELSKHARLQGQTLGFISFGNIPRLITKRARAFGLRAMAYDPYIHEHVMHQYDVESITDLQDLLQRSDFVSMHVPLSPATRGMVSETHFRAMKPSAIFLNTGRGPTVDENALITALQQGWIAYAGLDVFETEPVDPDNPLLKLDNIIVSAHVASASARMMPEACRRVGREIAAVLQGRRPLSPVNPQVLK